MKTSRQIKKRSRTAKAVFSGNALFVFIKRKDLAGGRSVGSSNDELEVAKADDRDGVPALDGTAFGGGFELVSVDFNDAERTKIR